MNRREKIMAAAVGVMVVALGGFGAVKKAMLDPIRESQTKARSLRLELGRLKAKTAHGKQHVATLRGLAARTFGPDENVAQERMRARLIQLLEESGLSTEKLVSQPLQGKRLRHRDKKVKDVSIGRSLTIRGKPEHVINFLYLLEQDPSLHRLQSISLSPDPKTGKMDLQLRFFTLILDGVRPAASADARASRPGGTLDGPGRERYDMIVTRDIFRPYVARAKVVVRPPTPSPPPRPYVAPPGPVASEPVVAYDPERRLRVAGLPTFYGVPEVNVRNASSGEMKTYKLGEKLGKGTIVLIDYRRLPGPADPKDVSTSRVILRIGQNYWAVEIGQSLADKRRMKAGELPAELHPPEA